jgi:hypothetical protein
MCCFQCSSTLGSAALTSSSPRGPRCDAGATAWPSRSTGWETVIRSIRQARRKRPLLVTNLQQLEIARQRATQKEHSPLRRRRRRKPAIDSPRPAHWRSKRFELSVPLAGVSLDPRGGRGRRSISVVSKDPLFQGGPAVRIPRRVICSSAADTGAYPGPPCRGAERMPRSSVTFPVVARQSDWSISTPAPRMSITALVIAGPAPGGVERGPRKEPVTFRGSP